jgi:hypothetical protein
MAINVYCITLYVLQNHIGGIMVSMLQLSTVDCWFEARSDQTEDCKIGISYF